jgi:hypothetical protein
VFYVALDVRNDLAGVELIPAPIKRLSGRPKLNNEVSREVLRLSFAPLLLPQPCVRTADEEAPGDCS